MDFVLKNVLILTDFSFLKRVILTDLRAFSTQKSVKKEDLLDEWWSRKDFKIFLVVNFVKELREKMKIWKKTSLFISFANKDKEKQKN